VSSTDENAGFGRRSFLIGSAAALSTSVFGAGFAQAATPEEDGSSLWLRYPVVDDPGLLARYRAAVTAIVVENAGRTKVHRHTAHLAMAPGSSEHLVETTLQAARDELVRGLGGLLGRPVPVRDAPGGRIPAGAVVAGTPASSPVIRKTVPAQDLAGLGDDGYLLRSVRGATVIAGNTDLAVLYGTFAFLRRLQTRQAVTSLDVSSAPRIRRRYLNYWETERLYAGNNAAGTGGLNGENGAIFDFTATGASAALNLPVILDRYLVAARAMASVGINGITINNVNANSFYLTAAAIEQEAALADALRPYGIRLAVSVNYAAPTDARFAPDTLTREQLDPYSAQFRDWWARRARQLQAAIPDFIGFTVKANSEGQPGPQDLGYDHRDGANALAAAVAPLGMRIFWRTFVYNAEVDRDRLKRPYLEFGPLDGKFADNVFIQTKNGPLDYQAREPVHPLFARMEHTDQAIELQITQEYTGQNTMLCYLGPLWEEVLKADTYATDEHGRLLPRRRVGDIVEGTTRNRPDSAIIGVANLGNATNLTGHHFAQANFFAFGRLAWDWTAESGRIAEDWVRMTWGHHPDVVRTIVAMMAGSREAVVNYQTPLGVAHQFRSSDHYGPAPGERLSRDDWSPVYYNQADTVGLGYDRSPTGSGFTAQYFPVLAARYGDIDRVPEELLMWFHHVPWDRRLRSGRIFWDELVSRYDLGVGYVTWMRHAWDSLAPRLDARRFAEVKAKLAAHETDAAGWRDTCVGYWKQFSGREVPADGPLSVTVEVAGISATSGRIPVPAGASPRITKVVPADPAARAEVLSQPRSVPGQGVVRVVAASPFGPVVKDHVVELVPTGGEPG
jgi:alpha-glucuronidase